MEGETAVRDTTQDKHLESALSWAVHFMTAALGKGQLRVALTALSDFVGGAGVMIVRSAPDARDALVIGATTPLSHDVLRQVITSHAKAATGAREVHVVRIGERVHVLVPLELRGEAGDYMIVSRKSGLADDLTPAVQAIAGHAQTVWRMRKRGWVTAMMALADGGSDRASRPILAGDNPFGLTRAEMRVCALVGEGLRPQAIADQLSTSITTVRTHLRGIYAKTNLPGMFDVLHHMQAHPVSDPAAGAQV